MKQIISTSFFRSATISMTIALSSLQTQSFAFQYAILQGQATQGVQWFGSAPIQKEEFTITVYPDYLDVQLDLEIALGGNKPAAYTDALEISGMIHLEAGSTVIGMLLWNGNKILKAKLKTKEQARKAYEEVVDRNVTIPPQPKDPALLERIGEDTYNISIFPVEWGGFRKLRLRYLVPSSAGSIASPAPLFSVGTIAIPQSFSEKAKYTLLKGPGIMGFDLARTYSDKKKSFYESSVVLDPFLYGTFNGDITDQVDIVVPILEDSTEGSRLYLGSFFGNGFSGQALNAVYKMPTGLLDEETGSSDAKPRVFATLMGETDSCRKEISQAAGVREELKILARETMGETIKWSVFLNNELKNEIIEKPRIIRMEEGMQYARSFGNSRVYPLAKQMPFSLGSAFGFIDKTYALLALEEDVLPAITAEKYLISGVPTLNPEDIFPAKEDTAISTNAWSAARGYKPEDLLMPWIRPLSLNRLTGLPRGIRYSFRDGNLYISLDRELLEQEKNLGISIYSIKGKRVKEWGVREFSRGEFSWSPSESGLSSGAYVIKVRTGIGQYSQTVFLR